MLEQVQQRRTHALLIKLDVIECVQLADHGQDAADSMARRDSKAGSLWHVQGRNPEKEHYRPRRASHEMTPHTHLSPLRVVLSPVGSDRNRAASSDRRDAVVLALDEAGVGSQVAGQEIDAERREIVR